MNHVAPSLLKVEKHYKDAKEIQALKTNIVFTAPTGLNSKVVEDEIFLDEHLIWSNGKYAKIVS